MEGVTEILNVIELRPLIVPVLKRESKHI